MSYFRTCMALALLVGFTIAQPDAFAQKKGDDSKRVKRPGKLRPPRESSKARPRGPGARYAQYAMNADAIRKAEFADMVVITQEIYELTDGEMVEAFAVIQELQEQRWTEDKEMSSYASMLDKRAKLCGELVDVDALRKGSRTVYRELMQDAAFSSLQRDIREFERRHPHRYTDCTDVLEERLPEDKVEKAHREWHVRARSLTSKVSSRGLLAGIMIGPGRRDKIKPPDGLHEKGEAKRGKPRQKEEVKPAADEGRQKAKAARPPKSRGASDEKSSKEASKPKRKGDDKRAKRDKRSRDKKDKKERRSSRRSKRKKADQTRPLNEWEKYTRDFITQYELSDTQKNSALSILRDLTFRADQINRANQDRIDEAKKMKDRNAREARLATLNRPIDDLFRQLKRRLDCLLTAAQRSKGQTDKRK